MKRRWICLLLPILTIVLELLPYGAVCNFGSPNGAVTRETYSYFSLVPFGYANVGPMITAVLSCIVLVIGVAYCASGKRALLISLLGATLFAFILSGLPLLHGVSYYSLVSGMISLSLMLEMIVEVVFLIKINQSAVISKRQ